ncbi:virion structural protein [Pseudomonas phage Phabio]|uniref:Virion structural protein n=1 Tax=Pseudomonas phage Phabio TaxID=2006668 RepID=A0A1Y0SZV8_9CAUD|nr:virion structural protein [Pseudomonas phage Phabio]ARV77069.1 virion structural protein [Pseudomonas phage Phabio]
MKVKLHWIDANPGQQKTLVIYRSDHYTTIESPGTLVVTLTNNETEYTDTVPDTAPTIWYRIKTTFPNGNWSMSDPFQFDGLTYNGPGSRSIVLGDGFLGVMDVLNSDAQPANLPNLNDYERLLGVADIAATTPVTLRWFKVMYRGEIYYIPNKVCRVNPNTDWDKLLKYLDPANLTGLNIGKDHFDVVVPGLTVDPVTGIWQSDIMNFLYIGTNVLSNPQQNNVRATHNAISTLGSVNTGITSAINNTGYLIGNELNKDDAKVLTTTNTIVGINEVRATGVLMALKYTRVPFDDGEA